MARKADPFGYYALTGEDGFPVVCHALVGLQPDGAVPISEAEAKIINDDVTARSPKPKPKAVATVAEPVIPPDVIALMKDMAQQIADLKLKTAQHAAAFAVMAEHAE